MRRVIHSTGSPLPLMMRHINDERKAPAQDARGQAYLRKSHSIEITRLQGADLGLAEDDFRYALAFPYRYTHAELFEIACYITTKMKENGATKRVAMPSFSSLTIEFETDLTPNAFNTIMEEFVRPFLTAHPSGPALDKPQDPNRG